MNDKEYKILLKDLTLLNKDEKEELLFRLRKEMDILDEKLTKLLSERTGYSLMVGRVKRSLNLPTYSPEREREISKKINKFIEKPLNESALKRIYERILDESRAVQKNDTTEK
ncbi:MAG: chorismate mutase [Ignavibacteriales bacterium CG_4_9_14_3_um_filter_30_11]|nr:MAG: chorismate mutase [Ignavibacteriales bacterium CG_4_9_14_3_um_filter_30_11]